jgi:rhodanese-related sulfurtransferase
VTGEPAPSFRTPIGRVLIEAAAIVVIAALFGIAYTGLTAKGLFASQPGTTAAVLPPVLTYAEARSLFDAGTVLFVDARPPFDFGLGHIRGAVNLPLKDFDQSREILQLIPRDQPLVTYCDGEDCNSSVMLAAKLDSAGYKSVRVFFGGWKEWSARHLPVE